MSWNRYNEKYRGNRGVKIWVVGYVAECRLRIVYREDLREFETNIVAE